MTSMNRSERLSTLSLVVALTLAAAGCATLDGSPVAGSAAASAPAAYAVCTGPTASRLSAARANQGCRASPSLPPSLALTGGGSTRRMH